jgi:hypothetical protein
MSSTSPVSKLREELVAEPTLEHLAQQLPDLADSSPIRVAFVGPYNAGKSSLLSALTGDLSISRDSKPETASVSYHSWNDLQLVDVPGWFSGFTAHDQTADEELRAHADLVAFCITVELGDENIVGAMHRVFGDLGFADRSVLVVNKSNSEDSDDEVILSAVQSRLGTFAEVPILFTDAQDYLDTVEDSIQLDDAAIEFLRADSNVPALADALRELADRNQDARASAQAQQAIRVIDEAMALLVPDEEERAVRAVVTELKASAEACRARLGKAQESEQVRLVKELAALANGVTDGIRRGDTPEACQAAASEQWGKVHQESLSRINATLSKEMEQLGVETSTTLQMLPLEAMDIAAPPPARSGEVAAENGPMRRMFKALDIKPKTVIDPVAQQVERVAKGGAGKESIAYDLARKLQPKKVFKPHGRLKDAAKIQDVASKATTATKAAPFVLPAAMEGLNWWRELRARGAEKEQYKKIRDEYSREAKAVGEDLARQFDDFLATAFRPLDENLAAMVQPLDEVEEHRQRVVDRLVELRFRLSSVSVSDEPVR